MADRTQKSWKGEKREQVVSEGKVCVCVRGLGWGVGGRGWGRKCKQEKEELDNRGDSQQGLVKCDGGKEYNFNSKLYWALLWDRHCFKHYEVLLQFSFYRRGSRKTARLNNLLDIT